MENKNARPSIEQLMTKREQIIYDWVRSICSHKSNGVIVNRYKHKCYAKDLTEAGYTMSETRKLVARLIELDKVCVWYDDPGAQSHPMMSAEDMLDYRISARSQLIWIIPSIWRYA